MGFPFTFPLTDVGNGLLSFRHLSLSNYLCTKSFILFRGLPKIKYLHFSHNENAKFHNLDSLDAGFQQFTLVENF